MGGQGRSGDGKWREHRVFLRNCEICIVTVKEILMWTPGRIAAIQQLMEI